MQKELIEAEIELKPVKPISVAIQCRDCNTSWPANKKGTRTGAEIMAQHTAESPDCRRFYFPPVDRSVEPNVSP